MAAGSQPRPSGAALVFGEGMMGMRATRFRRQPDTGITGLAAQRPAKAFRSPPNVAFTPLLPDPPERWRSKQQPVTAPVRSSPLLL